VCFPLGRRLKATVIIELVFPILPEGSGNIWLNNYNFARIIRKYFRLFKALKKCLAISFTAQSTVRPIKQSAQLFPFD